MSEERKKRIFRVAFTVLGVIVAALVINKLLDSWTGVKAVGSKITSAAAPIIVGAVIAFLMNPVLVFFDRLFLTLFEDRLIKTRKKAKKASRTCSVIITVILFLGIIAGLLWMVIPQLYESIKLLISNMDTYYDNIMKNIDMLYAKFKKTNIPESDLKKVVNTVYEKMNTWINKDFLPNLDQIALKLGTGLMGGLKFVYNFFLGIIASIYIMFNKEYLSTRMKKIIYATFSVKKANLVMDGVECTSRIFSQFIGGKILDSIIIGLITFIVTTIVKIPYALLVSAIVGVTNVIPFFGPIIGAVPCVIIVLIADPIMSVILLLIILIIQQFDGNVLGPKILGDVTGLSSFWVLTSVVVGGGLFGFYGMLLGVPVFACCYMYINRVCTGKLMEKTNVYNTADFDNLKRIDEATGNGIYMTEDELDIRFKKKTPEEKAAIKLAKEEKKKSSVAGKIKNQIHKMESHHEAKKAVEHKEKEN